MLDELDAGAMALLDLIDTVEPSTDDPAASLAEDADPNAIDSDSDDGLYWARLLVEQCRHGRDDLRAFAPLDLHDDEERDGTPTLRQIAARPVLIGDTDDAGKVSARLTSADMEIGRAHV